LSKKKLLIILFIINTLLVISGLYYKIDNYVYNFIISFRSNVIDNYFLFITRLMDYKQAILLLIFIYLLINKKEIFEISIFNVGINSIIKNLIKRKRPDVLKLIIQGGYSYPSGHSSLTCVIFGYLIVYVLLNVKNKFIKTSLIILLILLSISICISRIYVGVHYFSDVIGGILLGINILYLYIGDDLKCLK